MPTLPREKKEEEEGARPFLVDPLTGNRAISGERPVGSEQSGAEEQDQHATVALRGGTFARVGHADAAQTRNAGEARFEPKRRGPMTAEVDGFNVQAAVRIEADEDEGRERLVRYCARHCFALERLSILPGGRVA